MRRRNRSFIEATLSSLLRASEYAATAEHSAESAGLLQRVDPKQVAAMIVENPAADITASEGRVRGDGALLFQKTQQTGDQGPR